MYYLLIQKIQLLEAAINDLKCVTQWLNVNRLSLNVDKTKLIIFHSKQKKINIDNLVIKLYPDSMLNIWVYM